MILKTREKKGYLIIDIEKLSGNQLDFTNIKKLRTKFESLLENYKNIALNLKNVKYIDSSAVGFIVDALNILRNNNGQLLLLNVDKKIIEIFDMTNLTKFLTIKNESEF